MLTGILYNLALCVITKKMKIKIKAAPLTKVVLPGDMALRFNKRLMWDPQTQTFRNNPEANQFVNKDYRDGWSL